VFRRLSIGRWALLAALLVGGIAVWIHRVHRPEPEWIPSPVIVLTNRSSTVQWISRPVAPAELGRLSSGHPGKSLAQTHCTRCHLLPSPDQLPRETWPFVLTWMANYVGYRNVYGPFQNIVDEDQIPAQPLIGAEEFRELSDYFLLSAKTEETWRTPPETRPVSTQFRPEIPPLGLATEGLVTLVHFEESTGQFYVGDGRTKTLQIHDRTGRLLGKADLDSEPVGIQILPQGFRLATLGDLSLDHQRGQVIEFTRDATWQLQAHPVVEGYHRLTQVIAADLNQDEAEDLLLVGFGQGLKGKVSILWRAPDGAPTGETVLFEQSGALNAVVHDFDGDGRSDTLLLTAQNHQELLGFINEGGGRFRRELIAKQFAGFGYNQLAIADFNHDSRMDLVLVNGNNMEIKNAPTKPYHGVRIWENQGGLKFKETCFVPLPGSLKAVAADFDGDGDVDLAVICYYPDWSAEVSDTFVYLENKGGYQFSASRLPADAWGHWITLESADVDQDGHPDLILGGGYMDSGVPTDQRERYHALTLGKPSVLVLRNVGKAGR
jgi:hypothetical protein